jgi:uncharacterized RDD family membrane protein YckC
MARNNSNAGRGSVTDRDTSQDLRYAPPQAHVEDVPVPGGALVPARRLQRFWAAMIDLGVAVASIWLVIWLSPWNPWIDAAARDLWTPELVTPAIGLALFAVVNAMLLARRGQTVGKAVLGLRMVRPDGSPASLARLLLVRYGIGYAIAIVPVGQFYFFIDAVMIFRASRRCLHDLLADTIVVKA